MLVQWFDLSEHLDNTGAGSRTDHNKIIHVQLLLNYYFVCVCACAGGGVDPGRPAGGHQSGGEDGRSFQQRRELVRSGHHLQGL